MAACTLASVMVMYTPAAFRLDDPATIRALVTQNPFAILISLGQADPQVTHLPVMVEPAEGPLLTLLGHLARPNPHAADLMAGVPQRVVVSGPHAYVSPTWYAEPDRGVPTWNYLAVHLDGVPEVLDEAATLDLLAQLTAAYEPEWHPGRLSASQRAGLLRGLVAFRLRLTRVEAKAKLSQNRSEGDRLAVRAALASSTDPLAQAVAAVM
ncbi:MAG: FMN-binding negative transcriptional regulator [Alphaproteobacteria bacterium]|nr:MAG: FMN-binding negative transcriptional regulator [Alphaproteobacteria bacterium]